MLHPSRRQNAHRNDGEKDQSVLARDLTRISSRQIASGESLIISLAKITAARRASLTVAISNGSDAAPSTSGVALKKYCAMKLLANHGRNCCN